MATLDTLYVRTLILEEISRTVADAMELRSSLDSAEAAERIAAAYIGGMTKDEIVAAIEQAAEQAGVALRVGDLTESVAFFVQRPIGRRPNGI